MSADSNKAMIRRYIESFSGKPKDEDALRRFVADAKLREHIGMFEAAFPRYELSADDLIAEGDKVVLRATFHGTHRGDLMGVAPTGKSVTLPLIIVYRIADGKIADHWLAVDRMELMRQLGVLPAPTAGAH
jgi:predicted ester cyclase